MRSSEEEGVLVFSNGEGNIPDPETMIELTWQITDLPPEGSTFVNDGEGNIDVFPLAEKIAELKKEYAELMLMLEELKQQRIADALEYEKKINDLRESIKNDFEVL